MKIIQSPADLRRQISKNAHPQVLVPTMGALHEGHFSLIRQAREIAGLDGKVMVSIFVNPIQFNNQSDLENYPVTLDTDLNACRDLGVDLVFTPQSNELYQPDRSVTVTEASLSQQLCGATRPGHFDGVCTVVCKLFNLFQPTDAIFGKKDFQQLAIIRRMVRDLDVPVIIHGGETVREVDGLAMSSRNVRLSKDNRELAPILREALVAVRNTFSAGEVSTEVLCAIARNMIHSASSTPRIDYLTIVDSESLQIIDSISSPAVLACAVFFDDVRLIDNIELVPAATTTHTQP